VNLKQIFEILKNSNKKLINNKHVDLAGHYNFGNIQDRLKVLILNFKILNLKRIFPTLNNFNKVNFNYKVIDCIENYNFGIDHINIQVCFKNLIFKFQNLVNWKTIF
jgi:hypothetical protein